MRAEWDFTVAGYRGGRLILQTSHQGLVSMQMEVAAWKEGIKTGRCDKIVVKDIRRQWQRDAAFAPYNKDLSEVIHG